MRRVVLVGLLAALCAPAAAQGADAWRVTGRTTLPVLYWQGVAFDGLGDGWYTGPTFGLWATTPALRQRAGVGSALATGEPFNHIGDLDYDTRENGRLLLPLECYNPAATPANFCGVGAVGVADPVTLARRYTVQLNGVPKAMWLALGPDGLLWTQAGADLLAFSADAIHTGVAAVDPVRSLPGVLDGEADGAAVLGGRLYFSRQAADDRLQLWSLDLATGARRQEAKVHLRGESEGIAARRGMGGVLHWIVAPGVPRPAYGSNSVLLHLNPAGESLPGPPQRLSPIRATVRPARLHAGRRTTMRLAATARVAGSVVPVPSAVARAAGRTVTLDAKGRATLRVRAPRHGRLRLTVARPAFTTAVLRLPVRR